MATLTSTIKVLSGAHLEREGLVPVGSRNSDDYYLAVSVLFEDTKDDAIDTLQMLQREVRALIEDFKPLFQPV